jgi:predicted membrane protein
MKDYKLLFILGLIIFIVPFLGIPEIIREWVVALSAIYLIGYAIYIRTSVKKEKKEDTESVFVESNNEQREEKNEKQEEYRDEIIERPKQIEEPKSSEDLVEEVKRDFNE